MLLIFPERKFQFEKTLREIIGLANAMSVNQWVDDQLHNILGFSQKQTVDYVIALGVLYLKVTRDDTFRQEGK